MDKSQENSKGSSNSFRCTPLLVNSFSRLSTSVNRSTSFNRTADSGYHSRNGSFTPSAADSSSQLYCSTPVAGLVLSHPTSILSQTSETPVHYFPSGSRGNYSEDRIPHRRSSTPLSFHEEEESDEKDVLGRLIKRSDPAVRKVLSYLGDEDLLQLSQVSEVFCKAICDELPVLKRLSEYLISAKQMAENRITSSRNQLGGPRPSRVFASVGNTMDVSLPGARWTVPSPLESIDMRRIPSQLKSLIQITKGLSDHQYVASCHSCRCLVPVRKRHLKPHVVECSSCQTRKATTYSCVRPPNPKKKALFSDFR